MEKRRDSFFLPNKKQKEYKPRKETQENIPKIQQREELKTKRQNGFNENRNNLENIQEMQSKKPFDKKTYRLKKYSKKYKLEQWEEKRKKKLLHDYYKEVKEDEGSGSYKPKGFDEDVTDSTEIGRYVRHPDLIEKENAAKNELQTQQKKNKKHPFQKAKEQYDKIKQEKLVKQQGIKKAKEERKQKLQEYKKKKQERFKKLSKKTKKGQPVMTGRLELLLEKIQKG